MKKIIALLIIFLFSVSMLSSAESVKAEEENCFEYEILCNLKLTDGFKNSSDYITRGEFTAIIASILSNRAEISSKGMSFSDEIDSPLLSKIKYMLEFGYVKLSENGTFRQNDSITPNDAMVILLDSLGYGKRIEELGGYYKTAQSLGLIPKDDGSNRLSWNEASKVIYTSLTVPKFDITAYGANPLFAKTERTFLDDLNLVKIEGVISNTKYTSITDDMSRNKVFMDYSYIERKSGDKAFRHNNMRDSFIINNEKIISYLGQNVVAFVSGFGYDDMLIECAAPYRNEIIVIKNDEFVGFDNEKFIFEYGKKNEDDVIERTKNLKISLYAQVTINGIIQTNSLILPNSNMFKSFDDRYAQFGFITLIDNTGDGVIDFIKVEQYQDTFISNAAILSDYIRLDDSLWQKPIFISNDLIGDGVNIISREGEKIEPEQIAKNDVISVMEGFSENGYLKRGTLVVSKNIISGSITSLTVKTEFDGEFIIDNSQTFLYRVIDTKKPKNYLPVIGDSGKFYTNFVDTVIYKDVRSSFSSDYGLLYMLLKEKGLNEGLKAKIYTSSGEWKILNFARYVLLRDENNSIGDKTGYKTDKLIKHLLGSNQSKTDIGIVTYTLNEDNEICEFSFAQDNIDLPVDKYRLTRDRIFNQPDSNGGIINKADYNKNVLSLGDCYFNDETPVFTILKDTFDKTMLLADEEVTVTAAGSMQNNISSWIFLYDVSDGNEISAALTIGKAVSYDSCGSVSVVTGMSKVSIDDEIFDKATVLKDGELVSCALSENVIISNPTGVSYQKNNSVQIGDIIEFTKDASGKISEILLIFRLSEAKDYLPDINKDGINDIADPNVNFYENNLDPKNSVRYYYGLATDRYIGQKFSKLTLNLNDDIISDNATYVSKIPLITILAADEETNLYNYDKNSKVSLIQFPDIVIDQTRLGDQRTGDLIFAKTVNGLTTDIVAIHP